MAIPLRAPLDFNKNEAQNLRAQNLASDPGSPVTGQVYYKTGDNTFRFYNGTSFLDVKDFATTTGTRTHTAISDFDTQVQTSRLDQMAAPTGSVSMNSQKITNLLDPTAAQDAATKAYVDAVKTGLDFKPSVRAASTANVSVTYNATGGTSGRGQITAAPNTLDGVTLAANDRILLKDQTTPAQNGIWVVSTVGTGANGVWDRATDFDQDAEVTSGAFAFVSEGTVNDNTGWVLSTNDPITIGGASGTSLAFVQFSSSSTSYGTPSGTITVGGANAAGSSSSVARADHMHAFTAPGAGYPTQIDVGDAQTDGTATTAARSDHQHALPSPSAPTTSAVGDAAAAGSSANVARQDHTHGREAFGAVTAVTRGDASATGSATTLAHSDHNHGFPFNPDFKQAVRTVATSNITLSGTQTIDGVGVVAGDRVLAAGQTTTANNGIYVVAAGAWSRATDADNTGADTELRTGALIPVSEGTTNADSIYMLTTNGSITIGTTGLAFAATGAKFASPTIALGTAAAAGSAGTVIRSDATIAAFDATAPTASAVGDAAATGSIAFAARRDHVHGREAFGAVTAATVGQAAANGSATTISHSDHTHGWPTGAAQKFSADVGDGSSTSITVTHNLNTKDVMVWVYDKTTPFQAEMVEVQHATVNTVTLVFATAPTSAQFRAVVIG